MKHASTSDKLMKTRSIQAQSLLKISLFSFSFASVASFCVLAICLDMALALGRRLRLSRSTDEGSEFRLQLPAGCLLAYGWVSAIGRDGRGSRSQGKKIQVS